MSYSTLYKISYTDYFDRSHEVLIQERDFSGSLTEVNASGNPFSRTHDTPSDYIHEPINGSFAIIRLIAETDFQFIDLYTADNRKYKVIHNIDSVLDWTGFLLSDQYQEQYKGPPYINEFIAADQLGYLRTLAWDITLTLASPMTILNNVLGATDLDLDLYEGINVYEDSNDQTTADSPLDQNYFDANVYKGKNYYEVLSELLIKFTAIIKQDRGKWFIYRPKEARTSFQRRLWTWGGSFYSYDSTELHDPIVSTTSSPPTTAIADMVRIAGPGTMFINQAWRNYTIKQSLQKKETVLINGDFSAWTSGSPDSWYKNGPVSVIQSSDKPKFFARATLAANRFLYQVVNPFATDRIKLSVSWEVFVKAETTMDIYFQLLLFYAGGPTNAFYEFSTDTWDNVFPKYFKRTYDNTGGSEGVVQGDSIDIVTTQTSLLGINSLIVRLYQPVSADTTNYIVVNDVLIRPLKEISATETEEYIEEQTFTPVIDSRNSFSPEDIEILCADVPSGVFLDAQNIYLSAMFTDILKEIPSSNWTDDGGTSYNTLIGLMQNNFSELYLNPQQVLSVDIISKLIYPSSVIQEINNSNRLFMIKRTTFHTKYGRWEIEAWQIGIGEGAELLNTDGEVLLNADGTPLLNA